MKTLRKSTGNHVISPALLKVFARHPLLTCSVIYRQTLWGRVQYESASGLRIIPLLIQQLK